MQYFVIRLNNYGHTMPKLVVNNKVTNLLNRLVIDGILIYFQFACFTMGSIDKV